MWHKEKLHISNFREFPHFIQFVKIVKSRENLLVVEHFYVIYNSWNILDSNSDTWINYAGFNV